MYRPPVREGLTVSDVDTLRGEAAFDADAGAGTASAAAQARPDGQTAPENASRPLAGYRILDLTTFLSGPFCTQILADLGAEVVKLEAPDGDSSRLIPPHFVGEDSAYFLGINRNKKSIAVDMKQAEGLALTRRLILEADIVVENFRPGVAGRIGLDIAALTAANPRLIWAS